MFTQIAYFFLDIKNKIYKWWYDDENTINQLMIECSPSQSSSGRYCYNKYN